MKRRLQQLSPETFIKMEKGEHHCLTGLENLGIVVEIWQQTDTEKPSD